MIVGVVAPRYDLATRLVRVLASSVTGYVTSLRRPLDAPPVALVVVALLSATALASQSLAV
jgi:hypothetical protein